MTETEVKLGSQEETDEKFASNMLSRTIVHSSLFAGKLNLIVPLSIQNKINAQFIPIVHPDETDAPHLTWSGHPSILPWRVC